MKVVSHTIRSLAPIIEDWVSDSEDESETKPPQTIPSFVQSTEQVKSPRHSIQHVKTSILAATPKPASPKPTSNRKRRVKKLERRNKEDEFEPAEVQDVVDVVTAANIITEVVTTASETITAASTTITAAKAQVPVVT
nr:hypothetical protein [Tanacetum cinerariifolium]